MPRFNFSDGRWAEIRPPTGRDVLRLWEDEDVTKDSLQEHIDMYNRALISCSWEGDMSDLPFAELLSFPASWVKSGEDDALPPDSAPPSETKPSEPPSPGRTGGRRGRQSSQRSSHSSTSPAI